VDEHSVELASIRVCLEEFETGATGDDDFLLTDAGEIANDCVGDGRGVFKRQIIQMHFLGIFFGCPSVATRGGKRIEEEAPTQDSWPLTRPVISTLRPSSPSGSTTTNDDEDDDEAEIA
jgi:hypothetical protein